MTKEVKINDLLEEVVIRGQLPRKQDGSIDLYAIDRILRLISTTSMRVARLKRLLEHKATPY